MARSVELIVEDGTGVENSNSFVTELEIARYAKARGIVIPSETDEDLDAIAILGTAAMDYLNSLNWVGNKTHPEGLPAWPRTNVPGYAPDKIPAAVIQAQMQLALVSQSGVILNPVTTSGGVILKEKIGPIETEYSEKFGIRADGRPIIPTVEGLLAPFLVSDASIRLVGLWALGS